MAQQKSAEVAVPSTMAGVISAFRSEVSDLESAVTNADPDRLIGIRTLSHYLDKVYETAEALGFDVPEELAGLYEAVALAGWNPESMGHSENRSKVESYIRIWDDLGFPEEIKSEMQSLCESYNSAFAKLAEIAESAKPKKSGGGGKKSADPEMAAIRAWAQEKGMAVGDRGRIPQEVKDAYYGAKKAEKIASGEDETPVSER